MLPLLAGAAAIAAVSMLSSKRPKPGDPETDPETDPADDDPGGDDTDTPSQGETGGPCSTGVLGQHAALDGAGKCVVFYDRAVHGEILREVIRTVHQELGPSLDELCSGPRSELVFPGTFKEHWRVSPGIEKIAIEALHRFYDLPHGVWPPTPHGESPVSPYWVHVTWGIAVNVAGYILCGWQTES